MAILAGCLGLALLSILPGWWFMASAFLSLGIFTALADFAIAGFRRKTSLFQKFAPLVLGSSPSEWLTDTRRGRPPDRSALRFEALLDLGGARARRPRHRNRSSSSGPAARARAARPVRAASKPSSDPCAGKATTKTSCASSSARRADSIGKSSLNPSSATSRCCRPAIAARRSAGRARPSQIQCPGGTRSSGGSTARLAASSRRHKSEPSSRSSRNEPSRAQGVNLRNRSPQSRPSRAGHGRDRRRNPGNNPPPRRDDHGQPLDHRGDQGSRREARVGPARTRARCFPRPRPHPERTRFLAELANVVFGPKIRFLFGAVLLAGCIAWMHQNAMISAEHATALVEAAKIRRYDRRSNACLAGVAHAREQAAEADADCSTCRVSRPRCLAIISSFRRRRRRAHPDRLVVRRRRSHRVLRHPRRGDPDRRSLAWGCRPWPASTRVSSPASSARRHGRRLRLRPQVGPKQQDRCTHRGSPVLAALQPHRSIRQSQGSRRGRVISSRIVGRPDRRETFHGSRRPASDIRRVPASAARALLEAIVWHRRKQVMGDVHVLPINEHRPAGEEIGEKHPRVGQSARHRRSSAGRRPART